MDHDAASGDLPRILYISNVPVENSLHGSSLLYRLLSRYPPERLRIIETGPHPSLVERRLAEVDYRFIRHPFERLRRTRFGRLVEAAAMLTARFRMRAIREAALNFDADAILTVTHADAWLSAIALAGERVIPYHLICHDEWVGGGSPLSRLGGWKDRAFRAAYRGAASRLCVSPVMAAAYLSRYGAAGATLYPARSPDALVYRGLSARLDEGAGGRVVAFAGSMNTKAMVEANVRLAKAIEPLGGTLVIYGPASIEAHPELARPNVSLRGLLPPDTLSNALRHEVDVLFLPMWFGVGEKDNERMCFPSKLTEYTNVGLPILISGDMDCAAAAWERGNPGVALVEHSTEIADLATATSKLFDDRRYAKSLATRAKTVGDVMFGAEAAEAVFHSALRRSS